MSTVVCFGEDWGRRPTTLQFLARKLSEQETVVWIESIGLRRPRFTISDLARIANKTRSWLSGSPRNRQSSNHVIVYSPVVLPFHGSIIAQLINRVILRLVIRRLLLRHKARSPYVLITANPATSYLVGHMGESKCIYYCADEYAEMPGVDPFLVRELDRSLLSQADHVVVTSEYLLQKKKPFCKHISILNHGVDLELFSQVLSNVTKIHPLLDSIPKPVFGFVGSVQAIIDFQLLATVAQQRRDWSFVLVGGLYGDPGLLPSEPNIHYLGEHSYDKIPSFIKGFDVCLIPYKLDERTRACNPVKLREYLASGKPVLSTPLPAVAEYKDVVAFASTVEDFIKEGEALLGQRDSTWVKNRVDRVSNESWTAVTTEFHRILNAIQYQ